MSSRSLLVTGGAGFIGSHLTDAALAAGYRVVLLDDLSTGRFENIQHLQTHPDVRFEEGSTEDPQLVNQLVEAVDLVFHLAAAVGVRLAVEEPVRTIRTNVRGAEVVLSAAQRHGRKVLLASSSEVYGKSSRLPLREDDSLLFGATDTSRWSYGASKILDEFLALAYHHQYDADVVIARLFNTVGPRQSGRYGMVIPRFVAQAMRNEPITVYGDGTQTRCFCHVEDTTRALLRLATHPDTTARTYNVGGTEEVTIRELAERVREITDSDSPIVEIPYGEAYTTTGFEDLERRLPDTTRIRDLIDWTPQLGLEEILVSVRDAISETGEQRRRHR